LISATIKKFFLDRQNHRRTDGRTDGRTETAQTAELK
jgi:hypothetical protein